MSYPDDRIPLLKCDFRPSLYIYNLLYNTVTINPCNLQGIYLFTCLLSYTNQDLEGPI